MKRSQLGILLGMVLSALLVVAIALSMNEERRQQLRSRLEEIRKALPGTQQLKQSAQEAATRARETGSDLSGQVQESAGKLVQHTQEILSTAQKKAVSWGEKQETKTIVGVAQNKQGPPLW